MNVGRWVGMPLLLLLLPFPVLPHLEKMQQTVAMVVVLASLLIQVRPKRGNLEFRAENVVATEKEQRTQTLPRNKKLELTPPVVGEAAEVVKIAAEVVVEAVEVIPASEKAEVVGGEDGDRVGLLEEWEEWEEEQQQGWRLNCPPMVIIVLVAVLVVRKKMAAKTLLPPAEVVAVNPLQKSPPRAILVPLLRAKAVGLHHPLLEEMRPEVAAVEAPLLL